MTKTFFFEGEGRILGVKRTTKDENNREKDWIGSRRVGYRGEGGGLSWMWRLWRRWESFVGFVLLSYCEPATLYVIYWGHQPPLFIIFKKRKFFSFFYHLPPVRSFFDFLTLPPPVFSPFILFRFDKETERERGEGKCRKFLFCFFFLSFSRENRYTKR